VQSLRYYLENLEKKGLLTTEPLGWNNVERFLKMGPCNGLAGGRTRSRPSQAQFALLHRRGGNRRRCHSPERNHGNNVQVGQSLMAIRSLREVWADANFKETQLRNLRIGQHVDLELDMYGGRHTFEGRISGVTLGTGSTLALLPAQNETGNFVKAVRRLPVRIDLIKLRS
jgi:hypothetical protein